MKYTLLLIALSVLIATSALAQIPLTMSFQGQLTDGAGIPVADGPFDVTFRLYDAASDGTMLWEEAQQVDVARGLFNVILGSGNPLNLPFDKLYWLGITIRTDAELKPRTALTSSPYSLNAPTAGTTGDGHSLDAADGDPEDAVFVDAAGKVGIGTATPGQQLSVDGVVESITGGFRFPDGTVQTTAATGGTGTTGDGHSLDAADGNPTDVVFVANDGNVGVGTATPEEKLDVAGNVRASGTMESTSGGFRFPDGTVQTTAAAGGATGDGHSLDAADGNPTDVVFVDNDGNVGIGTTNPLAPLHIKKANSPTSILLESPAASRWYVSTSLTGHFAISEQVVSPGFLNSFSRVRISPTQGDNVFLIRGGLEVDGDLNVDGPNFRVGIGTKTPGAKLEVIATSDNQPALIATSTSSFGGHFVGAENNGTTATVRIRSGSQRMLLDGNEIDAVDGTLFLNNNSHESVHIGTGPDNDGSNAALEITSIGPGGTEQTMLLDGNEIDAIDGTLFLNFNSGGDVVLVRGGGDVVVNTTVVHSSDRRLKKNITTLDGALDKVLNLRGVSFEWKKVEGRMSHPPKGVQLGVVAQEVEAVVPELVKTDAEGYKSVAYANITALLIEAVKAQQTTIAAQHAQMEELRSRVDKLESLMSQAAMLNK